MGSLKKKEKTFLKQVLLRDSRREGAESCAAFTIYIYLFIFASVWFLTLSPLKGSGWRWRTSFSCLSGCKSSTWRESNQQPCECLCLRRRQSLSKPSSSHVVWRLQRSTFADLSCVLLQTVGSVGQLCHALPAQAAAR